MRFLQIARSLALAASLCVAAVSAAHAADVGTLTQACEQRHATRTLRS
ncbi:hypothetical protein PPMP20_30380 [Paraburkholderia phymatum]|nr:hypothetical protein [Paraburkholderia phymatum]